MNQQQRKIRFLAQAANGFRGVPMMLFGLAYCISTILNYKSELDYQKNGTGKDLTSPCLFALLCLVLFPIFYPRIKNHFRRKFGQTVTKTGAFDSILKNLACCAPIIFVFFGGDAIDANGQFPFSVTMWCVSIFAMCLWLTNHRGISNALLYFSLVCFVSSFLPWEKIIYSFIVTDDFYSRAGFYRGLCSMLLGFIFFVMGLEDYRILKKELQPNLREENFYESV